jgi:hypothetical protein
LESRINALRSQVRRLLALYGLSWVVGLLIPTVIVLGLADWLIHLDAVVRLALLCSLGVLGAWLIFRYVLTPLFVRFQDLDIALRIEERWPGLNDRLASTVQFLRMAPDDDRFGSPAMREATVQQTLAETRSIDFRQAIDSRPALRAASLALVSVAVGGLFLTAAPGLSRIALRRLFVPFGPDRWPQQTHLTLLDQETPRKVARGESFSLAVAVGQGERVPPVARVTYRFDDGEVVTEALRSVEGGQFRGRIETVTRPFTFSVVAGDDSTSVRDIAVKVVPPPAIRDLAIRLIAPEYTRVAPTTLAPGQTQVRAVEGTRIEIEALANKPIEQTDLHLGEGLAPEPITFDRSRTRLTTHFLVSESSRFWFALRDTEGFRNREATRYELRSFRDEAPRVVIDEPANDRDVPAQATIPIVFSVDDDFGIQSARLIYKIAAGGSEPTEDVALPLWESGNAGQADAVGPVKHQEVKHAWNLASLKLTPGSIITFHADARDFDNLKGPNVGKSRELRLRILSDEEIGRELDDARREIREETARILAMQKQAQTPVEDALRKFERTDQLSKTDRDELKNAEMIQRQVGNRISSRTDGLDQKVRKFLDDLRNFKIPNPDAQRQMEEMKAGVDRIRQENLEPAEQGLTRASKDLEEAQASRAPNRQEAPSPRTSDAQPGEAARETPQGENQPASKGAEAQNKAGAASKGQEQAKASGKAQGQGQEQQKGQAADQSQQAKGQDQQKGKAGRGQQQPEGQPAGEKPAPSTPKEQGGRPSPTEAAKLALNESKTNQKAIADELQKMLDGLSEFETYRGVVKDAQDLLKKQEEAMKQANDMANQPELRGKTPENLTPDQKGDLANAAERQKSVAKGLQDLQQKMDEMAKRHDESDPLAASAMRGAAEQSRQQGTSAKMNEAAEQLEKNQMGSARSSQEQARNELRELIDSIQNRRERELARLVKELKNAEKDLQKLRDRQTENLRKTRDAQKLTDPKERADALKKLAKEQAELQKELDRQLKRLTKLNAEAAARAGARAASRMGKASDALDQDQGEQAGQEQDDALADLDEAQEQLEQTRKDAEEMLAMEQLLRMGDQLKSLAERQQTVVTRTDEYEKLRVDREGQLTLAQRTGIRSLGLVEAGLKEETGELAEKLEGAEVFALTLRRAAERMESAAQRLKETKTDEETKRAAVAAANRFKQLLDALKPDPPKDGGQQQGGEQQGGGQQGGAQQGGDGIPAAAQLKMLKALQQEINDRTEFYDELRRRNKELTLEQQAELNRLHEDQGTLADLVRDLTRPKKEDGEE